MAKRPDAKKIAQDKLNLEAFMEQPSVEAVEVPGYTPEQVSAIEKEVDLEEKYGDQSLEAFGTGVARGVVPGFDAIATSLGVNPERLSEVKDRNKIEAISGEATGLIGGAVLSGGSNIAARATLGGLANVAERKIAESVAKNIFKSGVEKSLARKIAEKSIEQGLATSVTGAAFGINQLVNEVALGEADFTGENLVAYGGTGAIINGVVGGIFGAGMAAMPVARQATDKVTGQLKKVADQTMDIKQNFAKLVSNTPSKVSSIVEDIASYSDDDIVKFASNRARWSIKDGTSEMSKKLNEAGKQIGSELNANYSAVDAASPLGVIPKTESHAKIIEAVNNYVKKNANKFDSKSSRTAIKTVKDQIFSRFGRVVNEGTDNETVMDFWKGVQEFGRKANNPRLPEITRQVYSSAYNSAKDIMHEYIERFGEAGAVQNIKNLNREYRLFALTNDALERKANTGMSDFLNWKDTILSVGAGALTSPGAGLAILASKKVLESDLKRKFVVLNTAARANMKASKSISNGIKGFFEGGVKAAKQATKATVRTSLMNSGFARNQGKEAKDEKEAFKNVANNLIEYRVNPDKLALKIASNTMKVGYAAPNATKFAQVTLAKAVSFLYEKMPKDMKAGTDILGDRKFEPSSIELSKFKRYVQAVENPYSVMEDIEQGTVTREHIEALRTVYPAIYRQIQDKTMEFVAEQPTLPYNKKVQLGILLAVPTDASLAPQSVVSLQNTFLEEQKDNGGGDVNMTVTGMKELKLSERAKTDTQDFATRED
jgi:hypothetical protein